MIWFDYGKYTALTLLSRNSELCLLLKLPQGNLPETCLPTTDGNQELDQTNYRINLEYVAIQNLKAFSHLHSLKFGLKSRRGLDTLGLRKKI